ncbi:hypothetical protein [Methanomassiliicoccus luminyensis]|uniref:hypothetical protein n=1 Tax=Methanomassiliicoccus luminyensis TaxID=1080712 RepID=UPI00037AD63D|nr:hypothetical protein [Methanomassiliicoccus luminyensis]
MSIENRIKNLEDRLNPNGRNCFLIVDPLKVLECPHGRVLSADLHECDTCGLVPPKGRRRVIMLDVEAKGRHDAQKEE